MQQSPPLGTEPAGETETDSPLLVDLESLSLQPRCYSPTSDEHHPLSSPALVSRELNDQPTPLPSQVRSHDSPRSLTRLSPRIAPSPTLASLSELLVSPPIPDSYESAHSYFPRYVPDEKRTGTQTQTQTHADIYDPPTSSSTSSQTPSEPSLGRPPKAASDSAVSLSLSLSSRTPKRSPRIRNHGSVLAPHGSFTSARNRSSTVSSSLDQPIETEMDTQERERLFIAASRGDQLAMRRLGWRPPKLQHRHTLGATEDIWGTSLLPSGGTRRSSSSSQAPSSPRIDEHPPPTNPNANANANAREPSDLISDAYQLTLRSNASANTRQSRKPS